MALNKELNNGIKKVIEQMLSKCIPIEQIAELTEIPIEKIIQISKNLN